MRFEAVAGLLEKGVNQGVFPGAVVLAARFDQVLFHCPVGRTEAGGKPVARDTIYDLASLTKPLATTPAVMSLVQSGKMSVNDRLSDIIPACRDTNK